MATNFNVAPYYDDYDINDGYLRILFKPGVSVQARELTQLQSILQQQVTNLSDHFFKEGAMIVPGQSAADLKATFVKITINTTNSYINPLDFVGRELTGGTSGIKAIVIHAVTKTGTDATDDPDTIYVKYLAGATGSGTNNSSAYTEGDSLAFFADEVLSTTSVVGKSDYSCKVRPQNETPTGIGSIAYIETGIYFIQGHLVQVKTQKIELDKYSNTPSYKIGLQVNETLVSSNDKTSLLDNAQGTPNYNAPGADRYKQTLILAKRGVDETNTSNFISLISIRNGQIESAVRSTEYSVLEDNLARRTYDESGDYTVRPYKLDVRELFQESSNRGVRSMPDFEYDTEVQAMTSALKNFFDSENMVDSITGNGLAHTISPTDRSTYPNQTLDTTGTKYYPGKTHLDLVNALRARIGLGVEAGKSYVRGYEVENLSTNFVNYLKARDDQQKNNEYLTSKLGNYIYVSDIHGIPTPNSDIELLNIHVNGLEYKTQAFNLASSTYAHDPSGTFTDAGNTHGADVIGTAKVKYVEFYGDTGFGQEMDFNQAGATKFAPVSASGNAAVYKVYLYDVLMADNPLNNRKYLLSDMRAIQSAAHINGTTLSKFNANLLIEYQLTDVVKPFLNNNLIFSEFQDQKVRGMVYYNDTISKKILVKPLGGGNFSPIASAPELTPRLFELNEVVREVTFSASPTTAFAGGTYNIENQNARVIKRTVMFEQGGASIVDTQTEFVKTVRFVDEDSGNVSVDTSYTVQRVLEPTTVTGSGGPEVVISLGASGSEKFQPFTSGHYFAYMPAENASTPAETVPCTSSTVSISADQLTCTITGFSAINKSAIVFVPIIKQQSTEKNKSLNERVIFPYLGKNQAGALAATQPTNFSVDNSTGWAGASGDILGESAISDVNPLAGFTDTSGATIKFDEFQLQHSDIYKLKNVYDTVLVSNVAYQVDVLGTIKFYHEMDAADFTFASKAWEYKQRTQSSPYIATTTGAPFITEIAAAGGVSNCVTGSNQPTQIAEVTSKYELDDGQRPGMYDIGSISLLPGETAITGRPTIIYSQFTHGTGDYCSVDSYTNSGVTYENLPEYRRRRLSDVLDFRPTTVWTQNTNSLLGDGTLSQTGEYVLDNSNIITDFRHYLPRKDLLYINKVGKFFVKYGASSDDPKYPEAPDDGMVIYQLSVNPYTLTLNDVNASMLDNKRYTMRDIGKLEDRIKNIEYYTSLSMLEKETSDMEILDENGLNRFKNGFIVEPFTGSSIADVFDIDYNAGIDSELGELRPKHYEKNVPMKFWSAGSTAFQNADGQLFLPYTNVSLIDQPKSSKTINVNPFAIFTFRGSMQLFPESDEWRDVDSRPDLVINREGQFDNMVALAEESGILGTEWNNWQTTWAGSAVTGTSNFSEVQRRSNWFDPNGPNGLIRRASGVNETVTTTFNTSRTGIRTEIVPRVVTENMGERVLNTEIIPFIRPRDVYFKVAGLKPSTRLYPFFDNVDVAGHVFLAEEVVVNQMTQGAAAFIQGATNILNSERGQIFLRGSDSGHVVRVFDIEYLDTNSVKFYVLSNVDNLTWSATENMFFMPPDVLGQRVGNYLSQTNQNNVTNIVSSANGTVRGIFALPNTESLKFRTGTRTFKLHDQKLATATDNDTESEADYTAKGILETRQQTIINTRVADIVRTNVSENGAQRTSSTTTRRVTTQGGWYDPLAETIMIEQDGGAFISAVDLFFSTRPEKMVGGVMVGDENGTPVTLQIRNTVNGYPGQKILAKKTLTPNNVNVSEDGSAATGFTLDYPIYVMEDTEYCIVILSDCQDYRAHIARLGEEAADGSGLISKQAYSGVFFKSQNASTWTADQMEDLKFKVYRCQFDIAKESTLYFYNDAVDKTGKRVDARSLVGNCIGTTASSSIVTFKCKNHDLIGSANHASNYWVTITGLKTSTLYGGVAGSSFSGVDLNGTHKVVNTTLDTFSIDMTNQKFVDTLGVGVSLPVPSVPSAVNGVSKQPTSTGYWPAEGDIPADGRYDNKLDGSGWRYPQVICNQKFDVAMTDIQNVQLPDTEIKYSMKTTSGTSQHSDLMPGVKDVTWGSFVNGENLTFNTPKSVMSRYNEYSFGLGTNDFDKRSFTFKINLSSTKDNLSPFIDTRKMSTKLISNRTNSPQWTSTADASGNITDAGVNSASSGYMYNGFVSEMNAKGGSCDSKYITREIKLSQPSTSMKIVLTAHRPPDADIDVYYKIKTDDSQEYRKLTYALVARPSAYSIPASNPSEFREWEYEVNGLEEFSSFGVKIVMRTKNSATPAKVKDLRIVALAN